MIVKKQILMKILQSGYLAEINMVKRDGLYEAALYLNGRFVGGPPLPCLLDPPKGDLTHWMGNRPTIGLTESEAERIIEMVQNENDMLVHRQKNGWGE